VPPQPKQVDTMELDALDTVVGSKNHAPTSYPPWIARCRASCGGRARPRYASRGGGWCAARPHLLQRWVFRLSSVSIWAASHAHSDTPQQRNVACGRRECGSPSRRGSACTQVTLRLALWRGGTAGGHPGCMVRHPAPVVEPALPAVSATPHSLCTATIIDTPR
jgi:hypothetical protein